MNIRHFSIIGFVLLLSLLSGCAGSGGKSGQSGIEQSCNSFCQHAQALQCPEGTPLPDGTSCAKFCIDTENAGHDLNTACRIKAKDCAELAKCP